MLVSSISLQHKARITNSLIKEKLAQSQSLGGSRPWFTELIASELMKKQCIMVEITGQRKITLGAVHEREIKEDTHSP